MNKPVYLAGVLISLVMLGGLPRRAQAATVFITPSSAQYSVGQSLTVSVVVNTGGQAINAGEATITWSDRLSLRSIAKTGSIFEFWAIQPSGSDAGGRVVFSGGLPSPGYTGGSGRILQLTFLAKRVGSATVQVTGGKVLANDGQGTDILTGTGAGAYIIQAASSLPATPGLPNRPTPILTVANFPDQASWYNQTQASVTWNVPTGLEGVSYLLDQTPTTIPPEQLTTSGASVGLTVPSDGLWYVHLRGQYPSGWSSTATYIIRRDSTPPANFSLTLNRPNNPADPNLQLAFATSDATSGVARYTVSLDGGPATERTSPASLTVNQAGHHQVAVTAYDQAGNSQSATLTFDTTGYSAPIVTSVSSPLILLDQLVVHGTARAGDTVTVYANGQAVGQVIAGPVDAAAQTAGITVTVPWTLTSDHLFRPGTFAITATATGSDGQTSLPTPAVRLQVAGSALLIHGRPLATVSVVTPILILVLTIVVAILAVLGRLWVAVWAMHRRVQFAEQELEVLRDLNRASRLSRSQLESALKQVEAGLAPSSSDGWGGRSGSKRPHT